MDDTDRMLRGDILIDLSFLDDDITSVTGGIHIEASPETVWETLTDYDNLSKTLPKVITSRSFGRNKNDITLEQTGRTGILFFEKTVNFLLNVHEEYPDRISFEQLSGDFHIYKGEWKLETKKSCEGTFLRYRATIKPKFFAPPLLVSFVQRQDLPGILTAHKQHTEKKAPKA